jgi:type I site-specific restriction endonuclease
LSRHTRILIDDQLDAAGWAVNSRELRYANGTRPQAGQAIAIAEWPTESGPVDYALFIEGRCVGVIEAKRAVKDVPGRLGQTLDAMSTTDTAGFLKFDQVFPIADLTRKFPEATDRVQVATVQAMIRRIFEDPDAARPTPGTYDLIIVDEAHRG